MEERLRERKSCESTHPLQLAAGIVEEPLVVQLHVASRVEVRAVGACGSDPAGPEVSDGRGVPMHASLQVEHG